MDSGVISAPLIIRAISLTLSLPDISHTLVVVVFGDVDLDILKCLSAKPATWAECVMTNAWPDCANRFKRAPTADAVAPLIPVSTSSKTKVCMSSVPAKTTRIANIKRANSPPDAARCNGANGEPGFVFIIKVMSSVPLGVGSVFANSTIKSAFPSFKSGSSFNSATRNFSAAQLRSADNLLAALSKSARYCLICVFSFCSSASELSIALSCSDI